MNEKIDRPFLMGKKIYLRPFDLDDIEGDYLQWINDGEMVRFNETLKMPSTLNQAREYVEKILNSDNYIYFAVIEKTTGKHIGNVKLGPIDGIDRRTMWGRLLSKNAWGKVYGSEVMQLIVEYSFEVLNLNKMWDGVITSNNAAIKSNLNAGMKIEGEVKDYTYRNGKYESITILGMTKKEYFKMKNKDN